LYPPFAQKNRGFTRNILDTIKHNFGALSQNINYMRYAYGRYLKNIILMYGGLAGAATLAYYALSKIGRPTYEQSPPTIVFSINGKTYVPNFTVTTPKIDINR